MVFLPRGHHLLILWLQLASTVILEPKKIKSVTGSTFSPSICHEVMGTVCHHLNFLMLSSKPAWITFQEAQPCCDEEAYTTQWIYEPCHAGPPKTDRSQWRVLPKRGPPEKGMANPFSIPALRTPWTVWKGKRMWHWEISPQGQQVFSMLLGNSREIAPERMKRLGQSRNDVQLWMCLVVKVKSDAVKNNIA